LRAILREGRIFSPPLGKYLITFFLTSCQFGLTFGFAGGSTSVVTGCDTAGIFLLTNAKSQLHLTIFLGMIDNTALIGFLTSIRLSTR
jgi:hypothetical protein